MKSGEFDNRITGILTNQHDWLVNLKKVTESRTIPELGIKPKCEIRKLDNGKEALYYTNVKYGIVMVKGQLDLIWVKTGE